MHHADPQHIELEASFEHHVVNFADHSVPCEYSSELEELIFVFNSAT